MAPNIDDTSRVSIINRIITDKDNQIWLILAIEIEALSKL